ncbi:hypothetical protein EDB86DRAFT_2916525 [Lactarius hatsudake]|nr:hypothetical protein EDB86DRAFT_2980931 [Lactarius hatsudake]KAH8981760.1 hypothetical protein EDB86DRAFT_2974239 [Lactarius hatsudake]KAH8983692.1 hypothetical protein EDB86DRAFT_2965771 [Lactarius hatsudake]KAH8987347.1 hypothetical protein EDB86DRAFT_2950790 [Lactarius hatsudake]KAH8996936.1 hypothetical protein EDB86DRAFT_2916525 [Lactarius hatsudake]
MYIYNALSRTTTQPLPLPQAIVLVSDFSVVTHRRSVKSLYKCILGNESLSAIVDSPFPPPFLHALLLLDVTEGAPSGCAHPGEASPQHRSLALAQSLATCSPYDNDEGEATPLQPPRTVRPSDDNSNDGSDGDKGDNHGARRPQIPRALTITRP